MKFAPVFLLCLSTYGRTYLNLDFKTNVYPTLAPEKWICNGPGYDCFLDSLNTYSGDYSLRMTTDGKINGALEN